MVNLSEVLKREGSLELCDAFMKSNSKPVFLMINIVILICFNMLPEGCGGRTGTEISPTALMLNMFSKRAFLHGSPACWERSLEWAYLFCYGSMIAEIIVHSEPMQRDKCSMLV